MDKLIRTRPNPNCPLCDNPGERLYSCLHDRLFGAQGEWSISRCKSTGCGLVWLDPRPLEDDIYKAYATYYTHSTPGGVRSLRSRFLSTMFGWLVNVLSNLNGLTNERRDLADMHLNELPPGRLLEIGCGDGQFLDRMKGFGWTVEGVDFDAKAADAAKEKFGIDVKVGRLEEMRYPDGSFDAVTMRHVIEHVFDPIATMREVRRILKPGGIVVVLTPNADSLGLRTYGPNWRGLEPPRHIHIFTPRTLDHVASKAGLETVRAYSTAVNAWVTLLASMLLAENKSSTCLNPSKPSVRMILRTLALHYREARMNASTKLDGEECVLLARNGTIFANKK